MGRHSLADEPSQVRHPWRAVVRTIVQLLIGLAAAMPLIVSSSGLPETAAGVGAALAISATITRLMAHPVVNALIATYLPFLAADTTPEA